MNWLQKLEMESPQLSDGRGLDDLVLAEIIDITKEELAQDNLDFVIKAFIYMGGIYCSKGFNHDIKAGALCFYRAGTFLEAFLSWEKALVCYKQATDVDPENETYQQTFSSLNDKMSAEYKL